MSEEGFLPALRHAARVPTVVHQPIPSIPLISGLALSGPTRFPKQRR
jgi:hypothetical protein